MLHHLATLIRTQSGLWHGALQIGHVWQAGLVLLTGVRQGVRNWPAPLLAVNFGVGRTRQAVSAPLGALPLAPVEALQQLRQGRAWGALVQATGDPGASHDWLHKVREPGAVHDPVILMLLTDGDDSAVQLASLRAGADAVLPASAGDALIDAQLGRLQRRAGSPPPAGLGNLQGLHLDARTYQAWAGTKLLPLKPQLFRLLHCLMATPSRVYSLQALHLAIGADAASQVESVHAYVSRLRKVLRPHRLDVCIQTVHGVGYRYEPAAVPELVQHRAPAPGIETGRLHMA